jgi:hypothetical protein
MQLKDENIWAIAIGTDTSGDEKHFLVYANLRGFTIASRTFRTHSTLKELTERTVITEISTVFRVDIDRFQLRHQMYGGHGLRADRLAPLPRSGFR